MSKHITGIGKLGEQINVKWTWRRRDRLIFIQYLYCSLESILWALAYFEKLSVSLSGVIRVHIEYGWLCVAV
jgi:hypothetical protein